MAIPPNNSPERPWLSWLDSVKTLAKGEPPTDLLLADCLDVCFRRDNWGAEPDETDLYPFFALCWPYPALRLKIEAAIQYWSKERRALLAQCVQSYALPVQESILTNGSPAFQCATALLAEDLPPPKWIIERLLHEGLILFGGKSKRGKSWLALDLAMSVAAGRSAFVNPDFAVRKPHKVLYIALEDGKRRVQHRLRAIQPNISQLDHLHFAWDFPLLSEGGIELLTNCITEQGFELIIVDVLAKVEGSAKTGRSEKDYHEVYELFTPLQTLKNTHAFALLMLTHLRKQEADDVFDNLHGSVAYAGAQDVLWVMERKPNDDIATLHQRGKDAEDLSLSLRFTDGHWVFLGEGEAFAQGQTSRAILSILKEEERPLTIKEIMDGTGMPSAKYPTVRVTLTNLVKEDLILRVDRGRYAISYHAMRDELPY